jgi:hypothetical protein
LETKIYLNSFALNQAMKDHRAYLVTIGAFEMISGGVFLVHPHLLGRSVDSYSAQVYGAALASLGFSILYDALVSSTNKCYCFH